MFNWAEILLLHLLDVYIQAGEVVSFIYLLFIYAFNYFVYSYNDKTPICSAVRRSAMGH